MGILERNFKKFTDISDLDSDWYKVKPTEPTHTIEMPINIKKGEDYGECVIPCAFYTGGFGVDLNPSLVKKKTGKKIRDIALGEKVILKKDERIVLDNDNQRIIETEDELEKCSTCGKSIVVSEVREIQYRSCPRIGVKLSHIVDQDVIIPARFGIHLPEIRDTVFMCSVGMGLILGFSLGIGLFMDVTTFILLGQQIDPLMIRIMMIVVGSITSFVILQPIIHLTRWWAAVKNTLKPIDSPKKIYGGW